MNVVLIIVEFCVELFDGFLSMDAFILCIRLLKKGYVL
jgi:hypothetical protein